jgi:hypothetical protein
MSTVALQISGVFFIAGELIQVLFRAYSDFPARDMGGGHMSISAFLRPGREMTGMGTHNSYIATIVIIDHHRSS